MNKRHHALLFCVAVAAIGFFPSGLFVLTAQEDELDSLIVCRETQKLIFENQFVRVIETVAPPGNREPKHRHGRGLSIALSDYDSETLTYPGPKLTRRHGTFGEVNWDEPTIHEVHNIGTTVKRNIRIEVK